MPDGKIVIDTRLSTDNFVKDSQKMEASLKNMAGKLSGLSAKQQQSVSKMVAGFSKQAQAVRDQASEVDRLRAEYERLSNSKVETTEFREVNAQIEKAEKDLNKAIERKDKFLATGGSTNSTAFAKIQYDIDSITRVLEEARYEKDQLLQTGGAYTAADTSGVSEQLSNATRKLDDMRESLGGAYERNKEFGDSLKENNRSTADFGGALKKGLKKVLAYGFGIRSLFRLFGRLRRYVMDGIKSIVKFDDVTNKNVSGITSSFKTFKNALTSSIVPIINNLAPTITRLLDFVNEGLSKIGMFFAALGGSTTFVKAKKIQEDYAASLEETSDAAEELQNNLSGLDQIHLWQDGNSSAAQNAVEDLWETVNIDKKTLDLAAKVREAFEALKEPIEFIVDGLKLTYGKVKTWFNENASDNLKEGVKGALTRILGGAAIGILTGKGLKFGLGLGLAFEAAHLITDGIHGLFDDDPTNDFESALKAAFGAVIAFTSLSMMTSGASGGKFGFRMALGLGLAFGGVTLITKGIQGLFDGDATNNLESGLTTAFGTLMTGAGVSLSTKNAWGIKIAVPMALAMAGLSLLSDDIDKGSLWDEFTGIIATALGFTLATAIFGINPLVGLAISIPVIITYLITDQEVITQEDREEVWKDFLEHPFDTPFDSTNVEIKKQQLADMLKSGVITQAQYDDAIKNLKDKTYFGRVTVSPNRTTNSQGGRSTTGSWSVPHYANGTVLPPNRPHLAIVGDQRHGTNVEAPLDTIKQAVAEVMGRGGNYQFTAQINRKTLFDEMIDEARIRKTTTGKNPFGV